MSQFSFKSVEKQDIPLLLRWLQKPHISKWWPTPKKDEDFFSSFLVRIRNKNTKPYIVLFDGQPIGYIQTYPIDHNKNSWLPELPKNPIGIDQFIGESKNLRLGLGTKFIKAFITQLSSFEKDVTAIVVDPDPTNIAAIRCYEKVGFENIGIYKAPWGQAQVMIYKILR